MLRSLTNRIRPTRKFVIISYPRSGSSYLCSLLRSHPDIHCYFELYHPDAIYDGGGSPLPERWSPEEREAAPFSFLEDVWKTGGRKARLVGFKLFPWQAPDVLEHLISETDVRKILLRRSNRLRCYVSLLQAMETGQWSVTERSEKASPTEVEVDPDRFLTFCERVTAHFEKIENDLQDAGQAYLRLEYSEIAAGEPKDELFEFLEVGREPLSAGTIKQGTYRLEDVVINFAELSETLEEAGKWEQAVGG